MSSGAAADPKKRITTIGAHTAVQRAKGNYVTSSHRVDQVQVEVGIDGAWLFKIIPDLSAVVTVALMAQSPSNDVYSDWLTLILGGVVSARALLVLEANGTTAMASARCMPVKYTDLTWSDGTEVRSWSFITGRLGGRIGGILPAVITQ